MQPINRILEKHFRLSILNSKAKSTYDLESVRGRQDYLHRIYVEITRKYAMSKKSEKELSLRLDKIRRHFVRRYGGLE